MKDNCFMATAALGATIVIIFYTPVDVFTFVGARLVSILAPNEWVNSSICFYVSFAIVFTLILLIVLILMRTAEVMIGISFNREEIKRSPHDIMAAGYNNGTIIGLEINEKGGSYAEMEGQHNQHSD
jgi:hypothetical protein